MIRKQEKKSIIKQKTKEKQYQVKMLKKGTKDKKKSDEAGITKQK